MTAYHAPIRDMIFAMKEIGGLDRIAALPGYEDASDDLVEADFRGGAQIRRRRAGAAEPPGDIAGLPSARTAW